MLQELQEKVEKQIGDFNEIEWQFAIGKLHNNELIDIKKVFEETLVDVLAVNIEFKRKYMISDFN